MAPHNRPCTIYLSSAHASSNARAIVRATVGVGSTLHQKRTQVRFWIPATIPAPYEPPWSGLSENIKIKKIYRGTLTSDFSKTSFLLRFT